MCAQTAVKNLLHQETTCELMVPHSRVLEFWEVLATE